MFSSVFLSAPMTRPGWPWVLIGCFLPIIMQLNPMSGAAAGTPCFPGLYEFGDSLLDTGNAVAAYPDRFNRTGAGRFSDGKLLGDFSALAIGQSPPSAYLKRSAQTSLQSGANFAVAGSTVLDDYPTESLSDENFLLSRTPFNLEKQIQWWRNPVTLPLTKGEMTTTTHSSVNESLHLILVGATDYLLQYSSNFSQHQVLASVPMIVNRIAKNLEALHEYGAQTVLAVNLPPLGCTAAFLSMVPGKSEDYDSYGCLKSINTAILRHNQQLYRAVSRLQRTYKSVSAFVYADFYKSVYDIVEDPQKFGFDRTRLLKACCGVGGAYDFSRTWTCGGTWVNDNGTTEQVAACEDPSRHLTWDGYHLSESVTRIATMNFFQGKHVYPSNALLPNDCKANFTSFWGTATLHEAP